MPAPSSLSSPEKPTWNKKRGRLFLCYIFILHQGLCKQHTIYRLELSQAIAFNAYISAHSLYVFSTPRWVPSRYVSQSGSKDHSTSIRTSPAAITGRWWPRWDYWVSHQYLTLPTNHHSWEATASSWSLSGSWVTPQEAASPLWWAAQLFCFWTVQSCGPKNGSPHNTTTPLTEPRHGFSLWMEESYDDVQPQIGIQVEFCRIRKCQH